MKTKSYLEIKVPISFDDPCFFELREALKGHTCALAEELLSYHHGLH